MRHHQLHALLFGVQMMVHHHLVACGFGEHRCHFVYARHSIEVDAEYQVGMSHDFCHLVLMLVIAHHAFCSRQPMQKVGIGVGHYHCHFFITLGREIVCPRQACTHSVAVGRLVASHYYLLGVVNKLVQLFGFRRSKKIYFHIDAKVVQVEDNAKKKRKFFHLALLRRSLPYPKVVQTEENTK